MDDLKRQETRGFQYHFDEKRANRKCKFIQNLPHTKGKWAANKQHLELEPFQKFIICCLFGWLDAKGNYRFREAYIEIPRKNGKSILAASIGLDKFVADGEFGAEVYSGATTEKQAWEVFRPAHQMVERTPALARAFDIDVAAKMLFVEANGSKFEPVIGKPGDGASPSCAIIDEYHEHATDDLAETMRTGMVARDNPLLLKITTAGSDRSSPCYAQHLDVKKLLEGIIKNESLFAIIYTIDEEDDWKSRDALVKANPNFGVSVSEEVLISEQRNAVQSARLQNVFKTKHLNIWVNAAVAWMNMAKWDEGKDTALKLEDFAKEDCTEGVDLASRSDLASKVKVFRRMVDGKWHYYGFATHYLNEDKASESAHYQGWQNEDRLVVTPGNVTDYNWIAEDLVDDTKTYKVRSIQYDPYHGEPLVQFIQARTDWNKSVQFVEVRQNVENMSGPMKELEALVLEGRFHHDGDPVLAWMVANVVCKRDFKDNIFPTKEREQSKIDGAVALIMAMRPYVVEAPPKTSIYERRGIATV